jgi:hypothetical protein
MKEGEVGRALARPDGVVGDGLQLSLDVLRERASVAGPHVGIVGLDVPLVVLQRELRVDGDEPRGGLDVGVGGAAVDDLLSGSVRRRRQVLVQDDVQLLLAELAALLWSPEHPGDVAVELPHVGSVGLQLTDGPL